MRILILALAVTLLGAAEPAIIIESSQPTGIYTAKAPITWTVKAAGEGVDFAKATWQVKRSGGTQVLQGTFDLAAGPGTVTSQLDGPGTLLLEVVAKATEAGKKELKALACAAVEPTGIRTAQPAPDDFDAFWKAKLDELAAVPANPVLSEAPAEREGVAYWHLTMDNIRGTKIRGQLARPQREGRFPALLIVQWAGVYKLPKTFVTGDAAAGWLVLNISAHDLPIQEPDEFYKQQADGPLKNYAAIGNDDREKSNFLRMFLACARAADYLAGRPDWDGKTLAVTGNSQGGLQSLVTAGLRPDLITALMVNVPAGCDNNAATAGRAGGWPFYLRGDAPEKVLATVRYFDGAHFAARATCPALVGMGLIDTTSRPDGSSPRSTPCAARSRRW